MKPKFILTICLLCLLNLNFFAQCPKVYIAGCIVKGSKLSHKDVKAKHLIYANKKCPEIEKIHLMAVGDFNEWELLTNFEHLKILSIHVLPEFDERFVKIIAGIPTLHTLDISVNSSYPFNTNEIRAENIKYLKIEL